MRHWRSGLGILWVLGQLATVTQAATNEANVRLYLHSLRVEKGQASELGLDYFLEFSSYANWANPNAEFFRHPEDPSLPSTHFSEFLLTGDALSGSDGIEGYLWITAPEDVDTDADGVPDCYEVDEPISEVRDGGWFVLWGPGGVVADEGSATVRWQRAAGQARGQCFFTLRGTQILTSRLEFRHDFEVIEYAGKLAYVPSSGVIQGSIDLVQVGTGQRRLAGPLVLERANDLPMDFVAFEPSTWTNALGQTIGVPWGELARDMDFEFEYFVGPLYFDDGDPSTPGEPDYDAFLLGIDDPNDADGDGIPDLTDWPSTPAPSLRLRLVGAVPLLEITGTPGTLYRVQRAGSLMAPGWTNVMRVPLTNSSQTVPLPAPSGTSAFWRLVTP